MGKIIGGLASPLLVAALLEGGKLYLEEIKTEGDIGRRFDHQFYVKLAQSSLNTALFSLAVGSLPLITLSATAAYYACSQTDSKTPFGAIAQQAEELINSLYAAEHTLFDYTVGTFARLVGVISNEAEID